MAINTHKNIQPVRKILTCSLALLTLWSGSVEALTDAQIKAVQKESRKRCDDFFKSQAGKPFRPGKIKYDWNNRGDFTRHYAQSVVLFAMRAFYLNEQIPQANTALRELCQFHLDRPQTLFEIHSFPGSCNGLLRICIFYGPQGTIAPHRLTPETYNLLLKTMWTWASRKSKISQAEVAQSQTWHIENSENHHALHFSTCWAFSMILKEAPEYQNRTYEDGHTAQQHYDAWTIYLREYLRQRACKGMLIEIASPSYASATLTGIYSFYDFSDDATLKKRAGDFLTLYWALWAQEQLDAVRGGGKTRCYPRSAQGGTDFIRRAAWYYLGIGDPKFGHASMLSFVTSSWRMPAVVIDLALDPTGDAYEIRQRRMGLTLPGHNKPPSYQMRTDFGGIYRYSYCTADFIIGSLMTEARPEEDWAAISSQNRWSGVIFRGHPNARIYPQCLTGDEPSNYNQQWAVQKKGTLITQKLKTSRHAGDMCIWFSKEGLTPPLSKDPWVFVEAPGAFAAVRAVTGSYTWQDDPNSKRGRWLKCSDQYTPVIIEVAGKTDFADFNAFQNAVLALPFTFKNHQLSYTALAGDDFTFYADYSQNPRINGQPVTYAPAKTFDSPFVQSLYDSGIVTIQKGARQLHLDFNTTLTDKRPQPRTIRK